MWGLRELLILHKIYVSIFWSVTKKRYFFIWTFWIIFFNVLIKKFFSCVVKRRILSFGWVQMRDMDLLSGGRSFPVTSISNKLDKFNHHIMFCVTADARHWLQMENRFSPITGISNKFGHQIMKMHLIFWKYQYFV